MTSKVGFIGTLLAVASISAALGVYFSSGSWNNGVPPVKSNSGVGEKEEKRGVSDGAGGQSAARAADLDGARKEADEARAASSEAARKVKDLLTEIEKLKAQNAELSDQLAKIGASKSVDAAKVMANFDALKKKGLGAFLSPGATSDLVAALRQFGEPGTELLRGLLKDPDEDARFLAAKLLEDLSDPKSADALETAALDDPAESVANMASHALALMDDPSVLPHLRSVYAKSEREGVRVNTMYGMAKLGDAGGIEACRAYLTDTGKSPEIAGALGAGILLLRDPRAIPLADVCVDRFHTSARMMELAIAFYSNVGTPESMTRLQRLANDSRLSTELQLAAARALSR